MAAVHTITATLASGLPRDSMANRRVPLQSIPNAVNSPSRPVAPGTKRTRSQLDDLKEYSNVQLPPTKKLQLDQKEEDIRDRELRTRKKQIVDQRHVKEPARKTTTSRHEAPVTTRETEEKREAVAANLESVRQWQRHYRKVFPTLVFYFEGIQDDVKRRISRQVQALGSREELFFSRAVTHVVTGRDLSHDGVVPESTEARPRQTGQTGSKTIDPLLLETQQVRGGRNIFDQAILQRKLPNEAVRKSASGDILNKARHLNMKIWTLEKLERMLKTMFETITGEHAVLPAHTERAKDVSGRRTVRNADLSQLLQQEKLQTDRDWMNDMVPFKGYYIYVHDMEEKTKPVMMRDYARTLPKESGKWPQLRITDPGRCPFLDEPTRQKPGQEQRHKEASRTRAAAKEEKAATALQENNNLAQRSQAPQTTKQVDDPLSKPLDPPKSIPVKRGSTDNLPLFGSAQASLRQMPRYAGGEPIASGVQPSNVTSAIRSQMISSTAAQPGAKAGASRELNMLQRRIAKNGNNPAQYMQDIRGAINGNAAPVTRSRQREALAHINEEDDVSTEPAESKKIAVERKRKNVQRDPKPGYCENCRAKFEDFDQHILSKSHRKFATSAENWVELDGLLSHLVRPLKVD